MPFATDNDPRKNLEKDLSDLSGRLDAGITLGEFRKEIVRLAARYGSGCVVQQGPPYNTNLVQGGNRVID